jgi:hypothetical protein
LLDTKGRRHSSGYSNATSWCTNFGMWMFLLVRGAQGAFLSRIRNSYLCRSVGFARRLFAPLRNRTGRGSEHAHASDVHRSGPSKFRNAVQPWTRNSIGSDGLAFGGFTTYTKGYQPWPIM